jgi:1-acyl-sn-glycerol-3-phosphate acyltransferase
MSDLKPQVYRDERPPETFLHFHRRTRKGDPNPLVYNAVRVATSIPVLGPFRGRAIAVDNVPASGPTILAPNHFSQWDHFIAGAYLRRKIQFMAKSQMFSNWALSRIFKYGGTFPVMRGHGDEDAIETSLAILRRDGLLLMYPEGGRSRNPGRLGTAKAGLGRIALMSGAPVVPVAIHNSDKLRRWRQDWTRLRFPRVTVQYGEPMRFDQVDDPDREQSQRVSEAVFERVAAMYEALTAALEAHPRREVLHKARQGVLPAALIDRR